MKLKITDQTDQEFIFHNVEEIIADMSALKISFKYRVQKVIYNFNLITREWNMTNIKAFKVEEP